MRVRGRGEPIRTIGEKAWNSVYSVDMAYRRINMNFKVFFSYIFLQNVLLRIRFKTGFKPEVEFFDVIGTVEFCSLLFTVTSTNVPPIPFVYRNLKSENFQDYAQKPQRNFIFVNSVSGQDLNQRPNSWRNLDKSHKSFPPCYSLSPLQLGLEISIPSNSHNLLQFL